MAQTINLPIGASTFGNSVNVDIAISTLNTTGINEIKTLNSGSWVSWSNGAPVEFQSLSELKKGLGFFVNTTVAKTLTLTGTQLDINTMTYTAGINMISIPYDGRKIGDGYVGRVKIDNAKCLILDPIDSKYKWRSWSLGLPDFTTTEMNQGYVVDISTIHGSYLDKSFPNKSEGVRFNTNNTTVVDNTVTNGLRYTNPNALGALSFDAVSFDITTPTIIMFFSVDGKVAKLDYPIELSGKNFFVEYNGATYRGAFTENNVYASPTIITDIVDNNTLEITYTPIAGVNATTATYKEMVVTVGTSKSVVEFATEYLGATFKIIEDGKIGTGVFTTGNVTVTI